MHVDFCASSHAAAISSRGRGSLAGLALCFDGGCLSRFVSLPHVLFPTLPQAFPNPQIPHSPVPSPPPQSPPLPMGTWLARPPSSFLFVWCGVGVFGAPEDPITAGRHGQPSTHRQKNAHSTMPFPSVALASERAEAHWCASAILRALILSRCPGPNGGAPRDIGLPAGVWGRWSALASRPSPCSVTTSCCCWEASFVSTGS